MSPANRFKVLIVSGSRNVTERIERLLGLIETVEQVGRHNTAQDAIVTLREAKVDVILVDVNLPDMNGIQFTETLNRERPDVQVIVLAQDKLSDIVINAMRSGAADFLTYDVSLEELRMAIHRAGETAFEERKKLATPSGEPGAAGAPSEEFVGRKGKVITVYSPKGGTGTTTLAINLAIALQDSEETVGLVDGNIQYGDVALLLNEVPTFSILDLVTRIFELDTRMVEDVMLLHKSSGIHVLTAPSRPEMAEKVNEEHFTIILDLLRQLFTYVIVNTSTYISDPCLAALEAADLVVLVTTQEIAAIRNTRTFLSVWDNLGKSKDRLMLVLNRFVKSRNITPERISERMGVPIALTIPEDDGLVFRSLNLGIPFLLSDKSAPPSQSVLQLANLIRKELG